MAKKKVNTNFRLGLNRQELIEAAQLYGKKLSTAKKDSTKRLEEYVMNKIGGRGSKVPEFSERERREIRQSASDYGILDALKLITYRNEKISGMRDDSNFLRLTISRGFSLFYDGMVTSQHIDELISRLPQLGATQVDSDMINISPYYQQLFEDYAEELEEEKEPR